MFSLQEEGVYLLKEGEDHLEEDQESKSSLSEKLLRAPGTKVNGPHLRGIPERADKEEEEEEEVGEGDELNESKLTNDQTDPEAFDEEGRTFKGGSSCSSGREEEEGDIRSSAPTMGKSSRVPSPKKLVVSPAF